MQNVTLIENSQQPGETNDNAAAELAILEYRIMADQPVDADDAIRIVHENGMTLAGFQDRLRARRLEPLQLRNAIQLNQNDRDVDDCFRQADKINQLASQFMKAFVDAGRELCERMRNLHTQRVELIAECDLLASLA